MKQVLKNLEDKKIVGTCEVLIYERIEKELLTKEELDELNSRFSDDYESAYVSYGLCYDFNEELNNIILDTLVEGLKDDLKDKEPDEESMLRGILAKIEPFRKYDLDFE